MPSRMRLSAPTDGFIWLDSISEIVELVTPDRLASSRCDNLLRARTKRSRSPTSMLMTASRVRVLLLSVLRIERMLPNDTSKFNDLSGSRKGLAAHSSTWCRWDKPQWSDARDPSSDSEHPAARIVLDAVHGQPSVQGRAAPVRLGGGHA